MNLIYSGMSPDSNDRKDPVHTFYAEHIIPRPNGHYEFLDAAGNTIVVLPKEEILDVNGHKMD